MNASRTRMTLRTSAAQASGSRLFPADARTQSRTRSTRRPGACATAVNVGLAISRRDLPRQVELQAQRAQGGILRALRPLRAGPVVPGCATPGSPGQRVGLVPTRP